MPTRTARARRRLGDLRVRILLWYLILVAASLTIGLLTIRQVLRADVNASVNSQLEQEIDELELFAQSEAAVDVVAGDVAELLRIFLSQNVPDERETLIGLADGQLVTASPLITARQQLLPALGDRWTTVTETTGDEATVPGVGVVRWLAIPVSNAAGTSTGTFVVTVEVGGELDEIDDAVRVMALVFAGVLLLATLLAWPTAGRVLSPVRQTIDTARRISHDDLTERVPVVGSGEIAELGRAFNEMLDGLSTAVEERRVFLDDLGHELRTPLTIVRGQLEVIPDEANERADAISVCLDEIDRMERDVNGLITLAKSQRPDFVRPEPVELVELFEGIEQRARVLSVDHRWVLEELVAGELVCDRDRVTQAMMIFANNAARHTPAGGTVRFRCRLDGGTTRLSVSDTGPGIPTEEQDRLFERFEQGHTVGVDRSVGMGLGLAIASAIAKAHGGRVELDSATADEVAAGTATTTGSTFTLVLPGGQALTDDIHEHDAAGVADGLEASR